MRTFGLVLAAVVTAAALAADAVTVERIVPYSVQAARRGGTARASFAAPTDAAARDLRHATLAVRVGDEPTALFDARTPGLRIDRSGLRARFAAPKRTQSRIAKFRLSVVAGTLSVSVRGEPLESRRPPLIELDVAGHVFRFDPAFPDGPPPPVVPLPVGVVTFSTCSRAAVAVTSSMSGTVIRSAPELGKFLTAVTPSAADTAVLLQNDFSANMIVVAFGDATAQGTAPYAVTITSVVSDGRVLTVGFDKLQPSSAPAAPATAGPARAACVHAVAVPNSSMPVQFAGTPVGALNPWN